MTLYDLGNGIKKIQAALDSIEIKGHQNRLLLDYAYSKCDEMIQAINDAALEIKGAKEGDCNGHDPGKPKQD